MSSRIVTNEAELTLAMKWLENHAIPLTLTIVKGKKRSHLQNKLQRKWCNEVAEQSNEFAPEYVRGFCKLTMGVPILRAENDDFCAKYDRIIKPHTYEEKIEMMMEPLDFPVTRLMSTKQKTDYLDAIYKYWSEKGMRLTHPDEQGR